jgi:Ig-like domain-containing protein
LEIEPMIAAVFKGVHRLRSVPRLVRQQSRGSRIVTAIVFGSCLCARTAAADTLTVTWDPNIEPDVVGYLVSIGPAPGQYTSVVDVGNQTWHQFIEPDPNISYFFSVRAYNTTGLVSEYSQVVQSTPTISKPPLVTTGNATSVTATGGVLAGVINPNGSTTSGYFQFGPTMSYGSSTTTLDFGSGTQGLAMPNGAVAGLACDTVYNYRAVATNSGGTAAGANATFRTTACALPPSITIEPVDQTILSGRSATVSVGATGTGPLTYQWYLGTAGSTDKPIAGGVQASYSTPSLTSTTAFWVRVSNASGVDDSRTVTISVKQRGKGKSQ